MANLLTKHITAVEEECDPALCTDLAMAFSLRRIFTTWDQRILLCVRSSDSEEEWVHFDDDGIISTSSFMDDGLGEPGETTFGTWAGSDDVIVKRWNAQKADNIIFENVNESQASKYPTIMTAGVVELDGGLPTLTFGGANTLRNTTYLPELDSGNEWTIATVSSNAVNNTVGTVLSTTNVSSHRFALYNDRRTQKRNGFILNPDGTFLVDLLAQQNSGDQRILTVAMDNSKNFEGWYNGTSQDTDTYTNDYINDWFRIGVQFSFNTYLTGTIQEILIYDKDKTADIAGIHSNMNAYYSIY